MGLKSVKNSAFGRKALLQLAALAWSPSDLSISHLYFGNIVCSLQPGLHWIYIIDNYILASVRASQTLYSKVQI